MENNSINRVELRGRIGIDPRVTNVGETQVARFSVATDETYRDRNGGYQIATTWHNVVVWKGKNVRDFEGLRKGVLIHLVGHIRNSKYKNNEGADRYFTEVVATRLRVGHTEPQYIENGQQMNNAASGFAPQGYPSGLYAEPGLSY